jgi:hypothetical protein
MALLERIDTAHGALDGVHQLLTTDQSLESPRELNQLDE